MLSVGPIIKTNLRQINRSIWKLEFAFFIAQPVDMIGMRVRTHNIVYAS